MLKWNCFLPGRRRCGVLGVLLAAWGIAGCGGEPQQPAAEAEERPQNVIFATAELAAAVAIPPQFLVTSLVADDRLAVHLRAENRSSREQWFELRVEFANGGGVLQATAERTVVLPAQATQEIRVVSPTPAVGFRITVKPPAQAPTDMPATATPTASAPPAASTPPAANPPAAQPPPSAAPPQPAADTGVATATTRPTTRDQRVDAGNEEVVGAGIPRSEFKVFAAQLAEKIAGPAKTPAAAVVPTLVLLPFENRTTQQFDGQALAGLMAGDLRKAAGNKLKVVTRETLVAIQEEWQKAVKAAGGEAAKAPPRMVLKVSITSTTARRGGDESAYVLLTAHVTDLAAGEVVLEEEYEVKLAAPKKE